jgi:1-deoxy-D-xylulose-5-phosphate synthase
MKFLPEVSKYYKYAIYIYIIISRAKYIIVKVHDDHFLTHFFLLQYNPSGEVIPIGKGRIIRGAGGMVDTSTSSSTRGKKRKDRIAILSIGTRLHEALVAAQEVEDMYDDLSVTVADARYMKPLDVDLVRQLADDNGVLITIEEGSIGGFGDHVLHFLALDGSLDDGNLTFRPMVMPDAYFETGTQHQQYEEAGLNARHIKGTILRLANKIEVPILEQIEQEAQ